MIEKVQLATEEQELEIRERKEELEELYETYYKLEQELEVINKWITGTRFIINGRLDLISLLT